MCGLTFKLSTKETITSSTHKQVRPGPMKLSTMLATLVTAQTEEILMVMVTLLGRWVIMAWISQEAILAILVF